LAMASSTLFWIVRLGFHLAARVEGTRYRHWAYRCSSPHIHLYTFSVPLASVPYSEVRKALWRPCTGFVQALFIRQRSLNSRTISLNRTVDASSSVIRRSLMSYDSAKVLDSSRTALVKAKCRRVPWTSGIRNSTTLSYTVSRS